MKVAVVDYGSSNLRSVAKALEHVAGDGAAIVITGDAAVVADADRVVFPGQGAIGDCMDNIDRLGLGEALVGAMREKPFLGICLGLQTLLDSSEEGGGTPGFGIIAGDVRRFPNETDPATGDPYKIPHMGWNQVSEQREHPLWHAIDDGSWFYFVHSYYAHPDDPAVVAGTTSYATEFCSAIASGNLFAVQFHPEKSQHSGLRLLENFLDWKV